MNKKVNKKTKKKIKKPELLYGPFADWKNANEYPSSKEAKKKGHNWWAWEFLRRNPDYQKEFKKIDNLPPPSHFFSFRDLPQTHTRESKKDFLKRIALDNKTVKGKKLINQNSLYEWGILCARFGISRPVDPKVDNPFLPSEIEKDEVNDPSSPSPPLDFIPHLDLRNPMELLQKNIGMGLIVLDLKEPVNRNLRKVKEVLKNAQEFFNGEKSPAEKLKKTDRSIPWESFVPYLQLLDAESVGARPKDMICIFPEHEEPEKAVFGGLNKARKWRDEDYRLFRKEMACIFPLPESPQIPFT